MNIREILRSSTATLRDGGVAEPRREAVSLLCFALNRNQTFLIAHDDYELADDERKRFENFIRRRAAREPFQYITGRQEFYGLDFIVSPDVLIPRPETELLVDAALEIAPENARFCEIGIGSGCISTAILREIQTATAIGSDISETALKIARQNAEINLVAERLELVKSNVFENLRAEKFDLIVSNPPYISPEEMPTLQIEVRDYEPLTALTDGRDGLSIIEKIIADAPRFLTEKGFLLLEIGHRQSAEVKKMFDKSIWGEVETRLDWQKIERIVKARKR